MSTWNIPINRQKLESLFSVCSEDLEVRQVIMGCRVAALKWTVQWIAGVLYVKNNWSMTGSCLPTNSLTHSLTSHLAVHLPGSAREEMIGMWFHHRDTDKVREVKRCLSGTISTVTNLWHTANESNPSCTEQKLVSFLEYAMWCVYVWFVYAGVTLFQVNMNIFT